MEKTNPGLVVGLIVFWLAAVGFIPVVVWGRAANEEMRNILIGVLGFIAVVALIVWVISAGVRSGISQSPVAQHLPKPADPLGSGPGYFAVSGVVSSTSEDTRIYLEASSPANAKVKAELAGIVVTEVSRVHDNHA